MTKIYRFYSAGSIPGIAGIFAGVAVEVDETSNMILNTSPLYSGAETTTSTPSEVSEPQPQQPSSDNPEPAKE